MIPAWITPTDRLALAALAETGEEYAFMSFKAIAANGVPAYAVRRVVRKLARKGLAVFGKGLWTDDGMPAGSGYALTKEGRAIAAALQNTLPTSTGEGDGR